MCACLCVFARRQVGAINGQIGIGQFEIEQILLACQMQRAGFGQPALSLLQDMMKPLENANQGIGQGTRHLLRAIDIGQSNDSAQRCSRQDSLRSANWRCTSRLGD